VCEGIFCLPNPRKQGPLLPRLFVRSFLTCASLGGAHHPCCRAIAPYSIHIMRRGHIIFCKRSAVFQMRWGAHPWTKRRIRPCRFLDRFLGPSKPDSCFDRYWKRRSSQEQESDLCLHKITDAPIERRLGVRIKARISGSGCMTDLRFNESTINYFDVRVRT